MADYNWNRETPESLKRRQERERFLKEIDASQAYGETNKLICNKCLSIVWVKGTERDAMERHNRSLHTPQMEFPKIG